MEGYNSGCIEMREMILSMIVYSLFLQCIVLSLRVCASEYQTMAVGDYHLYAGACVCVHPLVFSYSSVLECICVILSHLSPGFLSYSQGFHLHSLTHLVSAVASLLY